MLPTLMVATLAQPPWFSSEINHVRDTARSQPRVTDKVTTHTYQVMYGMLLLPLQAKQRKLKILEIGLGCNMEYGPGASARLWREMLPSAELWMADHDAACVESHRAELLAKGIHTVVGDQGNRSTVQRWVAESGGDFDVVIDDGMHRNMQTWTSWRVLWHALKPGGIYFIEDTMAGRMFHRGDNTQGTMVVSDVIQAWVEQLLTVENMGSEKTPFESTASGRHALAARQQFPIPQQLGFVFCQKDACALGKKSDVARAEGQAAVRLGKKEGRPVTTAAASGRLK